MLEIISVKCLLCGHMIEASDASAHECWQDELDMQALEEKMWNAYQAEQAIEPVKQDLPWQERERLNDLERLAYCGYED